MFAAQTDFSEPGELAFFINPSQLAMLEATMHKKGVLESRQMGGAFAHAARAGPAVAADRQHST